MRSIYLVTILLLFSFCGQADRVPQGILSPGDMERVLFDLNLAEGAVKIQGLLPDSAEKVIPVYYNQVFAKHNLTREAFMKSYNYYLDHPNKMDKIHDQVLEELSKRESGLD